MAVNTLITSQKNPFVLNKKQFIAIGVALAAVLALYFGTSNVKPAKRNAAAHTENHDGHDHDGHDHAEHQPAGMMAGPQVKAADFDSLLADVKRRLLSPQVNAELNDLVDAAESAKTNQEKFTAYETLGKRWQAIGYKGIAAYYFQKAGDLESSEKILNFAAHLYEEGMNATDNASVRQLYAEGRVAALSKVVAVNPNNDTAVIDLAIARMEMGDVMNGVFALRDFAEKHPNNIRAQVTLGKMALQSNQPEKAIERANIILALDKDHFETHLFLGEAYRMKGDIDKAIEVFNRAKEILKNPDFDKDMDAYIATFKK